MAPASDPAQKPKRPSVGARVKGLFSRRDSAASAPEKAPAMRNIDRGFFGEDEEEEDLEVSLRGGKAGRKAREKREGGGLLDDDPDRAETDFFNGDKCVGDMTAGKRNGHGCYYYDSGDKYTGNWDMGKQSGHGVYVYANGDRYVGEWAAGKHHGAGTYYFKSGKVFQGTYRNGSPSGQGVFLYTNGAHALQ